MAVSPAVASAGVDRLARQIATLFFMAQAAISSNPRKRALAVCKKASGLNALAKSLALVSYREPTAAEAARGRNLGGRAAELRATKVAN